MLGVLNQASKSTKNKSELPEWKARFFHELIPNKSASIFII